MKNIRIYPRVLIVAFALSAVYGILAYIPTIISSYQLRDIKNNILPSTESTFTIDTVLPIINPFITLFLTFVTFYFIGKKIQTHTEFYSYFLSFLIGNAMGFTFGCFIITMFVQTILPMSTIAIVIRVVAALIGSFFSYNFFVGLSALALSYINRKNHEPSQSAEIRN